MDFSDLTRLASGHVEARILHAALSLGVFEALKNKAVDVFTVASFIQGNMRATGLLLNSLVALGLLEKKGGDYSLSEISSTYLIKDSPKYYGGTVLFESSLWKVWESLDKAVLTGKPVHPPDMYQDNPEETERFIYAMHSLVEARGDARFLSEKLDFNGVTELLDIGSGPGTYPIHFCHRHPRLKATIFDLPGTMKITKKLLQASGLNNRIKLITGDYRIDSIPGRYQMIFLSNIIHAESVEEIKRLISKLYSYLDQGGRIVIKDHILDDSMTYPPVGALFSLLMLLTTDQGKCYSFNDIKGWLESSGFKRVSEMPLPSPYTSSLIIGEKD
ncbi:MAG: methyltransferase [Candidatus Binatia bacterium]